MNAKGTVKDGQYVLVHLRTDWEFTKLLLAQADDLGLHPGDVARMAIKKFYEAKASTKKGK